MSMNDLLSGLIDIFQGPGVESDKLQKSARRILDELSKSNESSALAETLCFANLFAEAMEDFTAPPYGISEVLDRLATGTADCFGAAPPNASLRLKGKAIVADSSHLPTLTSTLINWRTFKRYFAADAFGKAQEWEQEQLWSQLQSGVALTSTGLCEFGLPGAAAWTSLYESVASLSANDCYRALGLDWHSKWEGDSLPGKYASRCMHLICSLGCRQRGGLREPTSIDAWKHPLFSPICVQSSSCVLGRGMTSCAEGVRTGCPEAVHDYIELEIGELQLLSGGKVESVHKSPLDDPADFIERARQRLSAQTGKET